MNEIMFVTDKGSKLNMKRCDGCGISSIKACYECVDKNTRLLDAYEKTKDNIEIILDAIRFDFEADENRKEYDALTTAKKLIRQKIVSMKVLSDPSVWNCGNNSGQQGNTRFQNI